MAKEDWRSSSATDGFSTLHDTDSEAEAGTLSDRAYAVIETAIMRGELEPGTRISEAMLAARFGISRGSLREAIRRLEGRKLLTRSPRQGVRVTTLSLAELMEVYELREALEGMACRLASEHMSDEDVEKLGTILDRHSENTVAEGGYFQSAGDPDFHFFIARASGNQRLEELLCGELYYLLRIYRYRSSTKPGRASSALAEHRRIVAAIRDRDPDQAEALMRLHIRRSRESLQRRELTAMGGPAVHDRPI